MVRDDRYALVQVDADSRVTAGQRIGVCTARGDATGIGLQCSHPGLGLLNTNTAYTLIGM